jgi:NitT/TauT family transport system ATP-binding protein
VSNSQHVRVEGLTVVYGDGDTALSALTDIDLAVERGEFVSIIGPSGCGKSTLLRVIGGLQAATSGRVQIDGRPPRQAQLSKDIGFVFQDASLLPWRSVIANVALPLEVSRRGAAAEPDALVDLVGLAAFRDYYPHQLSGGMQQRVAIARSLVTEPSLLLMDEPFGALDEITRAALRHELLRIWSAAGASRRSVIFVTHSVTEAVLLSDRVVVMTPQPGRIAADLPIELARPRSEDLELDAAFLEYARELRGLLRAAGPARVA